MIKAIDEKRKWISDRLIHFVDIVFGVVISQSILRNINLIQHPRTNLFQFFALIVVITTVTLSWIGYHKSMYKYPYKAEILTIKRIRPFSDFIIVIVYTILLFSIEDFKVPNNVRLFYFILLYAWIFCLYLVDGLIRINEYKDHGASKLQLSFKYFIVYVVLYLLYTAIYTFISINPILLNSLTLALCFVIYLFYRIQREPHYPPSSVTLVIDIDGVLADQVTPVLDRINQQFNTAYCKDDIQLWDQPLPLANTDIKTEIEKSQLEPDILLSMDTIQDAPRVLRELSKYCEITIATNRPRKADKPTKKWLIKNNIPFDNYVNTSIKGKGIVRGDLIIDDYPKNISAFINKNRMALLFTQPWNQADTTLADIKNVERVKDWNEILEKMKLL